MIAIVAGPNRVIIAYARNGDDTFTFHSTNRMTTEITFYGDAVFSRAPVPDELTIDLRVDNYLVPDGNTHYACQTFQVPDDKVPQNPSDDPLTLPLLPSPLFPLLPLMCNQEYHITQIEPLVNAANIAHVHHFVAHVAMNRSLPFRPVVPTPYPLHSSYSPSSLVHFPRNFTLHYFAIHIRASLIFHHFISFFLICY